MRKFMAVLSVNILMCLSPHMTANAVDYTVPGTHTTINNAVVASNTAGGSNTITISANQTITATIANIMASVSISGNDTANLVQIDMGTTGRFNFNGGNTYSLNNLSIINGSNNANGAVIYNPFGGLTINNCVFNNNTTTASGAVAYNSGRTTTNISNCSFTNNNAGPNGGVMQNTGATEVNITSSKFINNSARYGGAIYNTDSGNVNISNSDFENNTVTGNGGAIFSSDTAMNLYNCNFNSNSGVVGGAIDTLDGNVTIENCSFRENNSSVTGGAIYHSGGTLTINGSSFESNTTVDDGGGIVNHSGELYLTNSIFTNNESGRSGGAIYSSEKVDISNSTFTSNTAINGGAVNLYGSTITSSIIDNCLFQDNDATGSGGGIYSVQRTLSILNSTFQNNTAASNGGAINKSGALDVTNTNFTNNQARNNGGAVLSTGTSEINNCRFISNSASIGGALHLSNASNNSIENCLFENNSATVYGGAIYNSSNINMTSSIFNNNTANNGGAIYNSSYMNITSNIFNNNTANNGGAIYHSFGIMSLDNSSVITNNTASVNGGGIFNGSSGIINLDISTGDMAFRGNTAAGINNDIHNNGFFNITGSNILYFEGGISGNNSGVINKLGNSTIIFGADSINSNYNGTYTQTVGITTYYGEVLGGINNISNSSLNLFQTSPLNNVYNFNLTDVTVNSMNNVINTFNITNFSARGINNFSIDADGLAHTSDQFIIGSGSGEGSFNIDYFNFIKSPVDQIVDLPVFSGDIGNYEFKTSISELNTPIYKYTVSSLGDGTYRFWRPNNSFNKQVFRGQVSTLSSYYRQLLVNNVLFDHIHLDSELYGAFNGNTNKYAQVDPIFAPYQYHREEGSLWVKNYSSFEKLQFTHDVKVNNNAYGSVVMADFPVTKLRDGWKFLPTAFLAYNGGHQTFNGVSLYQNGGQGGVMGTFMKNHFIGSFLAYAGGYANEMSLQGTTDYTGNWFAGTAVKGSYNYRVSRHWIIQPTAFISYSIFGKQSWHSDFGSLSMDSGYLNGINVAPGVNFIYGREDWSAYITAQYIYNINDKMNGRAGSENLPNVRMKHGYIEYGVGFLKNFKERFMACVQITIRNGGRNGVGLLLGLTYKL